MSATLLRLRTEPDQRLDLSSVTPDRLRDLSAGEIARLPVGTTRTECLLGDVFDISLGDPHRIHMAGGSRRLDGIGSAMSVGEIRVEGDVGQRAGLGMRGGSLAIDGDAGPLAGARMAGGTLRIGRDAGAFAGGTIPGDMAGMRGGLLVISGSAGERLGDRMRRGVIVVFGESGPHSGSRMIGGTIVAASLGDLPGTLMRRGSIVAARHCEIAPTFVSAGFLELQFLDVLKAWLKERDPAAAALVPRKVEYLHGDAATLGRGEMLLGAV
jgi:formylmethanofuran dehydrogenase subunit C